MKATPIATRYTELVGVEYPILQDGMGGGALGTARLAAAVSNAGGLGSLSSTGMTADPEVIERVMRRQMEEALSLTGKPLAVNCPVGFDKTGKMLPGTEAIFSTIEAVRRSDGAAERQFTVMTTSAGAPRDFSARVHDAGMLHQHKVAAPAHAVKAVEAGADVIIASGFEMGGHTHRVPITTMVLAPEVLDRVDVPVLVSGGIKDGRGLASWLAAGAAGVAMGTRFLTATENDWHEAYIDKVVGSRVGDSVVMSGMYGPARFLKSRGTEELAAVIATGELTEDELNAWKMRHVALSQREGDAENGLTGAGLVACFVNDRRPAADIVASMVTEARGHLAAAAALVA